MKRLSDNAFILLQPDMDKVYGIRILDGEFYLLGIMEDAEGYRIKKSMHADGDHLERDPLIATGEILTDENMPARFVILYELDTDGNPKEEHDKDCENAHECFLHLLEPYTRNGTSDGDHDIFVLTRNEFSALCDALRDGDYIFVIE